MTMRDWMIYFFGASVISVVVWLVLVQNAFLGGISQMINGKAYGKDYSIEGVDEVLNSKDEYGPRKNYWSLVRTNDIDMPRRLRVSAQVQPQYLAIDGEALPEDDHLDIFMEQRVGKYAEAECELLKQHLVSECQVVSSNVRRRRDGRYRVAMVFAYVQKDPLGEFDKSGTVSYAETEKDLSKPVNYYYAHNEGTRDYRADLYQDIRRACDDLRFQKNNCAITEVAVRDGDLTNADRGRRVSASFTLSYFDTEPNS